MKTLTINLYEYSELTDEAKEKALNEWHKDNVNYDDPLMQSHMINLLKEKLDECKIEYDEDSIDVRYSLSHSQGDGFMFEGKLVYKGTPVFIKHNGNAHYYHSKTADIDFSNENGEVNISEEECNAFYEEYNSICKELEKIGYDEIEYQQSAEYFEQECETNEWTFEDNGKMRNVY